MLVRYHSHATRKFERRGHTMQQTEYNAKLRGFETDMCNQTPKNKEFESCQCWGIFILVGLNSLVLGCDQTRRTASERSNRTVFKDARTVS